MQAQRASNLLRAIYARSLAKTAKRNAHYEHQNLLRTYNDLPQPEGCWKTHYEAQQRRYNMHLLAGVSFTIATLIIAKAGGFLYLNYNPPAHPADKNNYE